MKESFQRNLPPSASRIDAELWVRDLWWRWFRRACRSALAIQNSGEQAVAEAVRDALAPFIGKDGRVSLPASYRVVIARS
jgi:hypothetical protein